MTAPRLTRYAAFLAGHGRLDPYDPFEPYGEWLNRHLTSWALSRGYQAISAGPYGVQTLTQHEANRHATSGPANYEAFTNYLHQLPVTPRTTPVTVPPGDPNVS